MVLVETENSVVGTGIRRYVWLLVPLTVGAFLRLYGIGRQVVSGDELHAVRAATSIDFPAILYTYQLTDHCIPLSAFYRLAILLLGSLSETLLRAPVVFSGLLVLVLFPCWTDRRLGRRTAQILAWWLALSPMLIYYSRIVRSYMPIVLLSSVAVACFIAWIDDRRPRFAAGYVICGALAIYFHPVAGPIVVAPLGWLVIAHLARVRSVPPIRSSFVLAAALLTALAAFLIPAVESLSSLVEMKHVTHELTARSWKGVAVLQAGTPHVAFVVAFWTAAVVGLFALVRKDRILGTLGIVMVAVQIAGLIVLSPMAMDQPNILNRYLLVCLPIVLIWVSTGLDAAVLGPLDRLGKSGRAIATLLAALIPGAFFFAGPVLDSKNTKGSFAHRASFTAFFKPPRARPELVLPEAYQWLSTQHEGAVVEYPWSPFWRYMPIIIEYQRHHGREVVAGIGDRKLWKPELRFRNMVQPWPDRILESRGSWLIVHLQIADEAARFDFVGRRRDGRGARDHERRGRVLERMDKLSRRLVHELTAQWGKAQFRTDEHAVWDLDRVRETPPESGDPTDG